MSPVTMGLSLWLTYWPQQYKILSCEDFHVDLEKKKNYTFQ